MACEIRIVLDPSSSAPLFRRIVDAIVADIRSGRLTQGAALPGTRRLAQILGVHRNTTVAAYRELACQGWIVPEPSRGTVVGPGPRVIASAHPGPAVASPIYPLRTPMHPRVKRAGGEDVLSLSHMPMPHEAPHVALARAYRRALRREPNAVLDYANRNDPGSTFGHPRLRRALATLLGQTRGVITQADDLLVTRGSQMALYLAAAALIEPGDTIAVEGLGYRPVWEAFRAAGARILPIPVDRDGLDVAALLEAARHTRIRAVYVTPHHQHPTGVELAADRRRALLGFAVAERVAILEDDFDSEFEYEGLPTLPLAAIDRHGAVVYVTSMSKAIAPGLRVGCAVAPRAMLELMAERRSFIDRQGDHAIDCAVAELIEDGELRRHLQRTEATNRIRRDTLAQALKLRFGDALAFCAPRRGTAIWAEVSPEIDVAAWHERALSHRVVFCPESEFSFAAVPSTHARFGFAGIDATRIEEAADRLAAALMNRPLARPRTARPVRGVFREPALRSSPARGHARPVVAP